MRAHGRRSSTVRLAATCLTTAIAASALSGCVSEDAYRSALRDAEIARAEAAQRDMQYRAQQAQLAWLAQQIEQRRAADPKATAELVRDLAAWADLVKKSAQCGAPEGDATAADATTASPQDLRPTPPRAKVGSQKIPPLDRTDPWVMPRKAVSAAAPRGRAALVTTPLDADDPWASLRPPLDGDDPWKQ